MSNESLQQAFVSAEGTLAGLKSLSAQLNSPDAVWRFIDLQSECLGRNGFAPPPTSRRWYWGDRVSSAGGNGIWNHIVAGSELGEQLVIGIGLGFRYISVANISEAYAGFIADLFQVPTDTGSSLSLNANYRGWNLNITNNQGKALYSTGENYQLLSSALLSLGFFNQPTLNHERTYQQYLSQLPSFSNLGEQFLPVNDTNAAPVFTRSLAIATNNVVNQRTNPKLPTLTETEQRERLGNSLPWGSIDAVIQALPKIALLLGDKVSNPSQLKIGTKALILTETTHPQNSWFEIDHNANIVGQIIDILQQNGGNNFIFSRLNFSLDWFVEQNSAISLLVDKHPIDGRKHITTTNPPNWYIAPYLDMHYQHCPLNIGIDADGSIDITIGSRQGSPQFQREKFTLKPSETPVTSDLITQQFLEHFDSILHIAEHESATIGINPQESHRITRAEMHRQITRLRETGAISTTEQLRMGNLVNLWSQPWDKKLKSQARHQYSHRTRSLAQIRYLYNYESFRGYSNEPAAFMPWQWIPEELVLRSLIAEELGPWLYSHTRIHLLELESSSIS